MKSLVQYHRALFWAFCGAAAMLLSAPAFAVDRSFDYGLATTNCNDETIDLAFYDRLEVFVDVVPIPASGIACPTDPADVDVPPSAVNTVAIGVGDLQMSNTVTVNLLSGLTYYARARACNTEGECSQLSAEVTIAIPAGRPRMPIQFILST